MVGLFGYWNETTFNCEVKASYGGVVIERPFSSKNYTLTIVQAEQLKDALSIVIAEAKSAKSSRQS